MKFQWGEVDGVATLFPDEAVVPGPLHAGLVFGVGRGDETMAQSGITHMVEHLALEPIKHVPYGWNGQVDAVATRFLIVGGPEQTEDYFREVATHLSDLPVDRLAQERQVLQIESEGRGGSQFGLDLEVRFGPRSAGLIGWPEHGLNCLEADDVVAWARQWFTAENAVLWLTGPIPRGLNLAGLPRGTAPRRDPPPPSIPAPRSWLSTKTRTVSLSFLSDPRWGMSSVMEIARERAFDRLRRRDALSYQIEMMYNRLGGSVAHCFLSADGADGTHQQIAEGLVAVVEELADTGPTADEMTVLSDAFHQMVDHPQYSMGYLDGTAERRLLGLPHFTMEEWEAKTDALTAEELRDGMAAVIPTMLVVGPIEFDEKDATWSAYKLWSADRIMGTEYRPIGDRESGTLIVGSDGVSWERDFKQCLTIRWDEAIAYLTWDSGLRRVVGPDGTQVIISPWGWRSGWEAVRAADDAVDPDRYIRLGEGETQFRRDPDDPDSLTHVGWLATIIGARNGKDPADLVLATDGILLLDRTTSAQRVAETLNQLRAADPKTLGESSVRNRWIPEEEIKQAEVGVKRFVRVRINGIHTMLTLRLVDGDRVKIGLTNQNQVDITRDALGSVLGPRLIHPDDIVP